MEENGTFVALIAINLGGIGLLATLLLAYFLFFAERSFDLIKSINLNIESLLIRFPTSRSNTVKGKTSKYGEEYSHSLHKKRMDIMQELSIHESSNIERTTEYKKLIDEALYASRRYQIFDFVDAYKKNIKDETSDILQIIIDNKHSFELYKILIKCIQNDWNNLLDSSSNKDNKLLSENVNYFKNKNIEIEERIKLIESEIIFDLNSMIKDLKKLDHINFIRKRVNTNELSTYILISATFGVLFPLVCISSIPYDTYYTEIFHVNFDISRLTSAILSFWSLLPYTIILSKIPSLLKAQ